MNMVTNRSHTVLATGLARVGASVCGFASALSAAAGATILFAWALDSSRPVSLMPLLAGLGLLFVAACLFIVRRALQIRFGRRASAVPT
jgi:hypothetical protein